MQGRAAGPSGVQARRQTQLLHSRRAGTPASRWAACRRLRASPCGADAPGMLDAMHGPGATRPQLQPKALRRQQAARTGGEQATGSQRGAAHARTHTCAHTHHTHARLHTHTQHTRHVGGHEARGQRTRAHTRAHTLAHTTHTRRVGGHEARVAQVQHGRQQRKHAVLVLWADANRAHGVARTLRRLALLGIELLAVEASTARPQALSAEAHGGGGGRTGQRPGGRSVCKS